MGWKFVGMLPLLWGEARPAFRWADIQVAQVRVHVELAENEQQRAHGLMFRKTLKENEGMFFIFSQESRQSFWMKNTLIPLSVGFFDQTKVLREVVDLNPSRSEMELKPNQYISKKKAKYVLEVNQGWFEKNKIKIGDTFQFLNEPRVKSSRPVKK